MNKASLRLKYESKKLPLVESRARAADRLLQEQFRISNLLLEAMDEKDLQKATDIIAKLGKIKQFAPPSIKLGIEKAESEMNKFTAGGPIANAWSKLKSKVGIDNPLVKSMTFLNALEQGFTQIPLILKNNGIKFDRNDSDKSINDIIVKKATGALSDEEMAKSPFTKKEVPNKDSKLDLPKNESSLHEADSSEQKLKTVVQQIRKSLAPAGVYGAFKKVPYVDSDTLTDDIVKMTPANFLLLKKAVETGSKTTEIAADLKQSVMGSGGVESKGTQPSDPGQPTSSGSGTKGSTSSTKASGTTPAGESKQDKSNQSNAIKAARKFVQKNGLNIDDTTLQKVINYLASQGLLK